MPRELPGGFRFENDYEGEEKKQGEHEITFWRCACEEHPKGHGKNSRLESEAETSTCQAGIYTAFTHRNRDNHLLLVYREVREGRLATTRHHVFTFTVRVKKKKTKRHE